MELSKRIQKQNIKDSLERLGRTHKLYKMSKVRAKFKCNGIQEDSEFQQKIVSFCPVISGSEENKSFAKYTPAGDIVLNISDETQAANFFEVNKEYYVDFTKAEYYNS